MPAVRSRRLITGSSLTLVSLTLIKTMSFFGRCKDFKAIHGVLVNGVGLAWPKTQESAIDSLVRAGRSTNVVSFLQRMKIDYGLKREKESLLIVVDKLCSNGYVSYIERMVKNLAKEFFLDERICNLLVKCWCVDGKLGKAKRLAEEMYRGGFEVGTMAYNASL